MTRYRIRGRRDGRRDQGAITLELAVLTPAIILLTLAVVQVALSGYADGLARLAAHEGANAARSNAAPAGAGIERARAVLDSHASGTLQETQVSDAGTTAENAHVSVSGRCLSVIPGLPGLEVRAVAQAPRERFTLPETP